jgi:hypothetical protein
MSAGATGASTTPEIPDTEPIKLRLAHLTSLMRRAKHRRYGIRFAALALRLLVQDSAGAGRGRLRFHS